MNRPVRKPSGWEHLFEVPGCKWEDQVEGMKAIHITIAAKDHARNRHIVVYAYHNSSEFNVCTYHEGVYNEPDSEGWMGPMEAMCLVIEAIKDSSTPPISKHAT